LELKSIKHFESGGENLYVIITYDVSVERVSSVCQYLRKYLNWVQNSVFEGELTISELAKIENDLKNIIDENKDSITIYILSSEKALKRKFLGTKKVELINII
jgi:CRISPR-associated protein Cas2